MVHFDLLSRIMKRNVGAKLKQDIAKCSFRNHLKPRIVLKWQQNTKRIEALRSACWASETQSARLRLRSWRAAISRRAHTGVWPPLAAALLRHPYCLSVFVWFVTCPGLFVLPLLETCRSKKYLPLPRAWLNPLRVEVQANRIGRHQPACLEWCQAMTQRTEGK